MTYAAGRLWEETAYLAYYLHWSFGDILGLPHPVRLRMIDETTKINELLRSGE